MDPAHAEKVKQLDFVLWRLLKRRQLLDRPPLALKSPLIQQTKCRFLLRNLFIAEDLVYVRVEIPAVQFDVAVDFFPSPVACSRLRDGKVLERFESARRRLEQEKPAQPPRLALSLIHI